MAKAKTAFFCQACGYQAPKWLGKCPSCGSWNTFAEELLAQEEARPTAWRPDSKSAPIVKPVRIQEVSAADSYERTPTGDQELDRVLGGGIVPGSLILIGGEPGIGKSTLMLQIALRLSRRKVLYISGEESNEQIRMRAGRLGFDTQAETYLLSETELTALFKHTEALRPEVLIIDSIQTLTYGQLESAAGSVSQVRECTAQLLRFAKETNTPVFLIGHITKDGTLAGPKVLEHMVDTVLQFEGDRHMNYRLLRAAKNRFGPTSELGIYEMQGGGLREVHNPSELLLTSRDTPLSGVAIATALEGNRPLLIELQALVSPATYGTPQRTTTGFDHKRMHMLLAVLEKRGGKRMGVHDVFLNVAGGLRIEDPALDLAAAMALLSSLEEVQLPYDCCFAAEVGLGGELRAVQRIESRIAEAQKLGFSTMYMSTQNHKGLNVSGVTMALKPMRKLEEVYLSLFGG